MIAFTAAELDRFIAEEDGESIVMLDLLRFKPGGQWRRWNAGWLNRGGGRGRI